MCLLYLSGYSLHSVIELASKIKALETARLGDLADELHQALHAARGSLQNVYQCEEACVSSQDTHGVCTNTASAATQADKHVAQSLDVGEGLHQDNQSEVTQGGSRPSTESNKEPKSGLAFIAQFIPFLNFVTKSRKGTKEHAQSSHRDCESDRTEIYRKPSKSGEGETEMGATPSETPPNSNNLVQTMQNTVKIPEVEGSVVRSESGSREPVHTSDKNNNQKIHVSSSDASCSSADAPNLLYTPCLTSLDINNINFPGGEELGKMCLKALMENNPGLSRLSLSWKGVDDEVLGYIKEYVPSLTHLSLVSSVTVCL